MTEMPHPQPNHTRLVLKLIAVIVFMGAMAWASIPLYSLFCRVTGFAGTTGVSDSGSDVILDRVMTIKFDGSKDRSMPWDFKPVAHRMDVKIGETALAFFEAHNPTDHVVAGKASYNVYPFDAGSYFIKIDCFCFTQQVLQPGETVQMPVSFFVDPDIVNDREVKNIQHITLSYTFHEIPIPEDYVAPGEQDTTKIN